jgi:ubiquinone/menaquinone biosynthesis C-methylase UbiE
MFPDGHFDLIYGRFLALALPPSDYEDLISECWRVCKPGGFVEFTELDMRIYGTQGSGTLVKKLNQQGKNQRKHRWKRVHVTKIFVLFYSGLGDEETKTRSSATKASSGPFLQAIGR